MSYLSQIILLLEEQSMAEMLKILLPNIVPHDIAFKCIPHEGKQDLERSIPRKLKAFPKQTKFIIIRDKDSGDCFKVKQKLFKLCQQGNRPDTLIRIPCHELESWYLGDLAAVEKGLAIRSGKLVKLQNKAKYRNPDNVGAAKQELIQIAPNYQPISGSRAIAQYLNPNNNNSKSFQIFIQGLKKIIQEIQASSKI